MKLFSSSKSTSSTKLKNVQLETILADLATSKMETVDLQHQQLSHDDLRCLLDGIQSAGSKVKTVNLSNCGIDDNDAELIATFLRSNTSVSNLALNGNEITTKGFAVMVDTLIDLELFTQQRQLYGLIHPIVETLEVKGNGKNTTLQTLSMANNNINDDALANIRCLTLGNSDLKTLDIHGNLLKDETKDQIVATQAYNHSIKIEFEPIPVKRPGSPQL